MAISIGVVGAGQFSKTFIPLFQAHPDVSGVCLAEVMPDRLAAEADRFGVGERYASADALFASDVDAVAIFTQRWTHGDLVVRALRAGKHVYSSVPMATAVEEIAAIIDAVTATGLTYMMGETSYYYPSSVFCRKKLAAGEFGRIFYAEGDYVHDMDQGFYQAYQYSGGDDWKRTASFPPMLYPTHAVGNALSVTGRHAVSVSCIGVPDERGDGVFDREISLWDNDISNATALYTLSDGGILRTNEFRRVGYPAHTRESRLRIFGTDGSFEQIATASVWQTRDGVVDVSEALQSRRSVQLDDPELTDIDPALREAFVSGCAEVHEEERKRLPASFTALPNGHEGSHHFLVDDFVRAVVDHATPTVDAWTAARYTLPGIIAHESAKHGGVRLGIPDFGDGPDSTVN